MKALRINGARAFGVRPGNPVLFKVAAVGQGRLIFSSANLPEGLHIHPDNGVITGILDKQGEYDCTVTVLDEVDAVSRKLLFVVGETICLTPFMGWNSWYCHSELISENAVRDAAAMMVETNLINHGWSYINIDDCWQSTRVQGKPLQANERFSDMKSMCDYIHSLGLKAGIYHTPWVSTYAGFTGGSASPDTTVNEVAPGKRLQASQIYGRYPALVRKKLTRVGENWLFDQDARQINEWGFDFIKLDWNPNDVETTRRMHHDLTNTGRDIVVSLSNEAPYGNAEGLEPYCHSLRTTSDIIAYWFSIARNFKLQEPWLDCIKPGYWIDPDMLQVGCIAKPNRQNREFKPSRLTKHEQISQMSLWCLLSAPLLITCEMSLLDDFTLELLTNDDAIDINQDYPAQPPVRIKSFWRSIEVWSKPLHDDHLAVGIFNRSMFKKSYCVDFSTLGLNCKPKVINVWDQTVMDTGADSVIMNIPPHGVLLWKTTD